MALTTIRGVEWAVYVYADRLRSRLIYPQFYLYVTKGFFVIRVYPDVGIKHAPSAILQWADTGQTAFGYTRTKAFPYKVLGHRIV